MQQGCRAALVRPAGTGKGRIVWEMLAEQPDTRVLWVASCAARLELRRGLAKELGKTLDGSWLHRARWAGWHWQSSGPVCWCWTAGGR